MKQVFFEILSQEVIAKDVMKMVLGGDTSEIQGSGGFVNIKIDGLFLRRPISICDYDSHTLTLIYKIVGSGTEKLSKMENGTVLDVLTGLGNGYDISKAGDTPLLIGGGVGVPPLYKLCKLLMAEGKTPTVILGFNSACDVFYEEEFQALGARVLVTTADGTYGTKGFVTSVMDGLDSSYFYTCGPEPMLKAVHKATKTSGQMSFEERMGCGFGACMGCSCKTLTGYKRICKEGPVMEKEEILW